ncbi:hypothetical protein Aph02nite_03220 [Actinoplanes philippinensis]|nr:hypothetical protein Aph02nite_03220 [Actinoplanes philippinensis]
MVVRSSGGGGGAAAAGVEPAIAATIAAPTVSKRVLLTVSSPWSCFGTFHPENYQSEKGLSLLLWGWRRVPATDGPAGSGGAAPGKAGTGPTARKRCAVGPVPARSGVTTGERPGTALVQLPARRTPPPPRFAWYM